MSKDQSENKSAWNLAACKCPRCREGNMFIESNPYKRKNFMKMPETCPVCGQYFDIEVGFYYGSSYVSYAFSIAISAATIVAWWLLIGFSTEDNRIFYWLAANAVILLVLQPVLMRLARTFWLAFFVRYDADWRDHAVQKPTSVNKDLMNAW